MSILIVHKDKLDTALARYCELDILMSDPSILTDYSRLGELNKERVNLEPIIEINTRLNKLII